MFFDQNHLKQFLVDAGLLSTNDWDELVQQSKERGQSLETLILKSGKIADDDYRRAKAYLLGVPFINLERQRVPAEVLNLIPEPIARHHNIIAFNRRTGAIEVAMLDPEDLSAIDFVKKRIGLKVLPRLTTAASIRELLRQYQKSLAVEFSEILDQSAMTKALETTDPSLDERSVAEQLPVVQIVDSLLAHAAAQKASDIHIEVYEGQVVVRYRIDGLLHDAMTLPKTAGPGIVARIKVLANLRLDEKRLPQDGRFKSDIAGQKISFRVSLLPTYFGEKVVMRLLPETAHGFTLEESGFHGEALDWLNQAIKQSTGMILVTGPTGSGKSTTLYTLLEMLNTPDVNISTIEDPIEYQISRVNQTQVKPDIGLTFANGLRALVRQDPDIIMVGEIRDRETAGLAINAALTGHLVLSTLHTNSAALTIPRLLDMGVEAFLLISTINVIIAKRLVRRLANDKENYFLSATELKHLKSIADLDKVLAILRGEGAIAPDADWSQVKFARPKVSEQSVDGYSGRIGIHEVLRLSPTIKELIIRGSTAAEINKQARKEGMLTLVEDGLYFAARGLTTLEEVFRVVND